MRKLYCKHCNDDVVVDEFDLCLIHQMHCWKREEPLPSSNIIPVSKPVSVEAPVYKSKLIIVECEECGRVEIDEHHWWCGECGAEIEGLAPSSTPAQPKKKKPGFLRRVTTSIMKLKGVATFLF